MTRRKFALAVSMAVSGMMAAHAAGKPIGQDTEAKDTYEGKHVCEGLNECKGLGGCSPGDNGCAAKNSCTGKGGCAVPLKAKSSRRLRRRV